MKKTYASRKGFTLLEVSVVTVLLGILTVSGASFFEHAARARMQARQRMAAVIRANSLMERVCQASDKTMYALGDGFLDPDNNMAHSSSAPSCFWTFDGKSLPFQIAYAPNSTEQAATIRVAVNFTDSHAVNLVAYRYCEE
jgi:prepilin-type N-terminal cleavage/methylation domain-containing protein